MGTLFLGSVKTLGRANQSDDVGRLLDAEIGREDSGAFASTSGSAEMHDMAELRRSGSFTPSAGRGQRPGVKTLGLTWADAQESAARLREKWAQFAQKGAFTPSGKRGGFTPSDRRDASARSEKRGPFTSGSTGKGKKHLQVELMVGTDAGGQERLEQPLLDTPQRRESGNGGEETPQGQLEGEKLVGASVRPGEAGQRVSCRCQVSPAGGQRVIWLSFDIQERFCCHHTLTKVNMFFGWVLSCAHFRLPGDLRVIRVDVPPETLSIGFAC